MYTKLTLTERKLIAVWLKEGLSARECGRRLNRSHSSVAREQKRNSFEGNFYEPLHAQAKADKREQKAWEAKHPLKNARIYEYVLAKLREGWSPEQAAGRLRYEHPSNKSWWICHETIYQWIYNPKNKNQAWWEYLRRKQKRRRKKTGRKVHRVRIPDRVSIHARPKVVDRRVQPGHWEGDSIVGPGHRNGLHTEYERVFSLTLFERLSRLNSKETEMAQMKIFEPLPKKIRRSTTLDNGTEMARHTTLKRKLGMKTYFADPCSAYQRGGNENANLWIRYYFPKKTDFSKISEEEIKAVEWELNNRPRKRLGFKTPLEALNDYLVQS